MYLRPWQPHRRKSIWPWFLAVIVAVAVGWFLYSKQREIFEAIAGPLPTPTPTEISAREYVAEADRAFERGQLDAAIAKYRRATELDPTLAVAYARWARIETLRSDTEAGVNLARRATEQSTADPQEAAESLAILAMALDWAGKAPEAVAMALKATDQDPSSAIAHAYLAEAYADSGRIPDALETADQALELAPDDPLVLRSVGYVHEATGQYQAAIGYYEQAIAS